MVSYFLGRRLKGATHTHWPFTKYPHWLTGAQALFERRGFSAIFISKFVGPLRPVVPFVAGAMCMAPAPFTGASIISSILWAMAFLIPSYYGIKVLGM
jgi:undecaprenyl-diphosphatase